ncbi:AGE family epimerase/isomerase [Tessaracoccus lapidicaptus]|uniref:AGE family epimerase/isomerase n=1 Tax=Tessaracoccus lapidicaptus TaxID=1427523 RepID=UPI0033407380
MTDLFGDHEDRFTDPVHREFLLRHRRDLLDFYQPEVRLAEGGMAWIGADGHAMPEMGAQLFIGARMMHVFSLAALEGRPGAGDVVEHGLDFYLDGAGRDHDHDGWVPIVGGSAPQDRKELYGTAQLLLAASSATQAGFSRGPALLAACSDLIDRRFWREEDGICVEGFDRTFTHLDDYRGQNANMHLTEAYLATFEATGERVYLDRALSIARRITGAAASGEGSWRLPEHFTADWRPMPDYNVDDPRHAFRPYGSQPGHWLEWTKLLLQLRGLGADEPWLLPAAIALFDGALADAWGDGGGFVYTVDWDGRPVVEERFFWEVAEAMGAARYLWLATGEQRFQEWYETFWRFADSHFIDHRLGSWHSELDAHGNPVALTWDGKPDLYHVYQATLYAELPADRGFAAHLRAAGSQRLAG